MAKNIKKYRPLQDIRVEVYLAALIQQKTIKLDRFLVRPVGLFKRRYSKDILKIQIIENDSSNQYIEIEVAREGLYEMLPDALFHSTTVEKVGKNEIEEPITSNRFIKEKQASRDFFLPIEQEFYLQKIFLEIEEQQSDQILQGETLNEKFSLQKFWGIEDLFTKQQQTILIYMLPSAYKIAGNLKLTAAACSLVMSTNVEIELRTQWSDTMVKYGKNVLSDTILGQNSVLSERFYDGLPTIILKVFVNQENQIIDFLEGGIERKKIDFLINYLLPVSYSVATEIHTTKYQNFDLATDNYLGLTTSI